jgi:Uma2 family endonuclease
LTYLYDDESVVVVRRIAMPAPRMTTDEYFRTPETLVPQELVYGLVREAASPTPGHQFVVGEIFAALREYLARSSEGSVWMAPLDVVLDPARHLIVQPDIVVVTTRRLSIVRDRVRGAPDLVVEVLSPNPRIGTLAERLEWFGRYGVRECWLVDHINREIEVLEFSSGAIARRNAHEGEQSIGSTVLPGFDRAVGPLLGSN